MKMSRAARSWSLLLGTLFTFGLWYIASWPAPTYDSSGAPTFRNPPPFVAPVFDVAFYAKELWPRKVQFALGLALSVFVLQIVAGWIANVGAGKRFYRRLLDHILKERFRGQSALTRITIYRARFGAGFALKYIWMCLIWNFPKHRRRGLIRYYLRTFPRPFRRYLTCYVRKGQPHERGTSTHFLVAENDQEITGLVPLAYYEEGTVNKHLPSIGHLDLSKYRSLEGMPEGADKSAVQQYTVDGMIPFDKLRAIHRASQNVWASAIYDSSNERWGVIVFDCDGSASPFDALQPELVSYCKIIGSVLHFRS